jgi:hypothetical protein
MCSGITITSLSQSYYTPGDIVTVAGTGFTCYTPTDFKYDIFINQYSQQHYVNDVLVIHRCSFQIVPNPFIYVDAILNSDNKVLIK